MDLANTVIRVAKELNTAPHLLTRRLERQAGTWPLLEFGLHIYTDYQRSLKLRGAVDFDDLILLAIEALEADEGYLHRLQSRWPFVLEDEAQDSSAAQQKLLGLLTAGHGNWVRVGDPNQAINTTFTSAKAQFLREFLDRAPGAGPRPARLGAQRAADHRPGQCPDRLVAHGRGRAAGDACPGHALHSAHAARRPAAQPAAGHPPAYVHTVPLTPDKETEMVLRSLQQRWLPNASTTTCAVLALDNGRGFALVEELGKAGVPFDDGLLRTDNSTRATAQALATVVGYIATPQLPGGLAALWSEVWYPRCGRRLGAERRGGRAQGAVARAGSHLRPRPGQAAGAGAVHLPGPARLAGGAGMARRRELSCAIWSPAFRADLQRWSKAAVLPVDELVLTVGNDLFVEPMELALAHRLALLLAKLAEENPAWRLPELAGELTSIAQNKRRILGFGEDAQGYVPQPGVVTVATMHGAKGLEWDRVYLMGANTFCFPSGAEADPYRAERWYVRDRLNLVAEVEAQLRQLHMGSWMTIKEGEATRSGASRAGGGAAAAALCGHHPRAAGADHHLQYRAREQPGAVGAGACGGGAGRVFAGKGLIDALFQHGRAGESGRSLLYSPAGAIRSG